MSEHDLCQEPGCIEEPLSQEETVSDERLRYCALHAKQHGLNFLPGQKSTPVVAGDAGDEEEAIVVPFGARPAGGAVAPTPSRRAVIKEDHEVTHKTRNGMGVVRYNKDQSVINYPSVKAAARAVGVAEITIRKAIRTDKPFRKLPDVKWRLAEQSSSSQRAKRVNRVQAAPSMPAATSLPIPTNTNITRIAHFTNTLAADRAQFVEGIAQMTQESNRLTTALDETRAILRYLDILTQRLGTV